MSSLRFGWSLLTKWCLCWAFTLDLHWAIEPTGYIENKGTAFSLQDDTRYTNDLMSTSNCGSRVECAIRCATQELCSGFNYDSSQCELLSGEMSLTGRSLQTGWSHGFIPKTGKKLIKTFYLQTVYSSKKCRHP